MCGLYVFEKLLSLNCMSQPMVRLSLPLSHWLTVSSWLAGLQVGKPSKSKHNVLPRGSLQFKSLTKEDHGEWECVATNVATSITASTHVQVIGTQHVHKHTHTRKYRNLH